jgi:hypothetical protein
MVELSCRIRVPYDAVDRSGESHWFIVTLKVNHLYAMLQLKPPARSNKKPGSPHCPEGLLPPFRYCLFVVFKQPTV